MNLWGQGMDDLLTAAQMRAIEGAAIDAGDVSGLELMERAGRGVIEAIFGAWPDMAQAPRRALVLCGPGNNGGDGFVVARLLKAWGWSIEVILLGDPARLPPDAKTNYERWQAMGEVQVCPLGASPMDHAFEPEPFDLLVDGLFGTGLTRPFQGLPALFSRVAVALQREGVRVVAIDIPSGLCSDSGRVLGEAIRADLTVPFHRAKLGHVLGQGAELCGALAVKDIGLSAESGSVPAGEIVRAVTAPSRVLATKGGGAHKYTHGHALVLTGGSGKSGAARLAARGALRVGAGLVTLGAPGAALQEVACQITALMLRRIEDAEGLTEVLADARFTALCLGPGLGVARAVDLVPAALDATRPGGSAAAASGEAFGQAHGEAQRGTRGVVLDADALTAFEGAPEALFAKLHTGCVLTPHEGEFRRLFPDIGARLSAAATDGPAYSKVEATRAAAVRAGCVVLFKGADTVIAAPDGTCAVHAALYDRAAPWLATAGSGDVLAGFITGLLARGLAPMAACTAAAWLHVECARRFGPGLIAEDLPDTVPGVLWDLKQEGRGAMRSED